MPLAPADLQTLVGLLEGGAAPAALRDRFPGLSVTRCDARDLDGDDEPFHRFTGFDLHLVDGRDHCWRLTGDAAEATGLLLAVTGG